MLPHQQQPIISPSSSSHHRSSSSGHHPSPSTQQACAACKYQRRKCVPNCILAPYFPHDKHRQFLNAHKLFGVSNITKIIKNLGPLEKDEAMKTIIYQSDARAHDPVLGCYGIIRDLQRQIELCQAELDLVLRQLDFCRQQEAAAAAALGCYDIIGSSGAGHGPAGDPFDNGGLGFHDITEQQHHVQSEFNGGFDANAWAMQDTATSTTVSNSAIMASSTCSSPPPTTANFQDQQQQQQQAMDNGFMNRPGFMGDCVDDDIKPLFGLDLSADDGDENRHEQIKFVSDETHDKRDQPLLELDQYKVSRMEEHHRTNEDDDEENNRRHEELLHDDLKDAATLFTLTNCST